VQLKELNINLRNKRQNDKHFICIFCRTKNTMTEKDYNPERRNKKVLANAKQKTNELPKEPIKKEEKVEEKKIEEKKVENSDEKKEEVKKPIEKKPVVKKTEAVVRGLDLRISTKVSGDICRFIKNKKISDAVADLGQVIIKKKAVPMRGEIPHRKGKIMAGRFPKNASENFLKLLQTLTANSNVNGLKNPVISEAVTNKASKVYGRFGRVQKKRTHVKIVAREKINKEKK